MARYEVVPLVVAKDGSKSMQLVRWKLLLNGVSVGCFASQPLQVRDLVGHPTPRSLLVLVLDALARKYWSVHPVTHRVTCHFTATCLSQHEPALLQMLQLRNRFLNNCSSPNHRVLRPCVAMPRATALAKAPNPQQLQTRWQMMALATRRKQCFRWPQREFLAGKLWNQRAKRFEIESIERLASVALSANGRLVHVRFLAPLEPVGVALVHQKLGKEEDEEARDGTGTLGTDKKTPCAWIEQESAVHLVAEEFAFAVEVLQKAKELVDQGRRDQIFSMEDETQWDWTQEQHQHQHQHHDDGECCGLNRSDDSPPFEDLSSLVPLALADAPALVHELAVEVHPNATYHVVRPNCCRSEETAVLSPTIYVRLHADDACIVSTDQFFEYFDAQGCRNQCFTAETLPPRVFTSIVDGNTVSYGLVDYCVQALRLHKYIDPNAPLQDPTKPIYGHSGSQKQGCEGMDNDVMAMSPSHRIIHVVSQTENEHGHFRAFSDGSVRVVFRDRTILTLRKEVVEASPPEAGLTTSTAARGADKCSDNTSSIHPFSCTMFLKDGTSKRFQLRTSSRQEAAAACLTQTELQQVRLAIEFHTWAFASLEQRLTRHLEQEVLTSRVQQELLRIEVQRTMNEEYAPPLYSKENKDRAIPSCESVDLDNARREEESTADVESDQKLLRVQELLAETRCHIASVNQLLQTADAQHQDDHQLYGKKPTAMVHPK